MSVLPRFFKVSEDGIIGFIKKTKKQNKTRITGLKMFLFRVTQVGPENSDGCQPLFTFASAMTTSQTINSFPAQLYYLVANDNNVDLDFLNLTPVFVFMALSKSIRA